MLVVRSVVVLFALAATAAASTIHEFAVSTTMVDGGDSRPVSATARLEVSAGMVTVELENTTSATKNAAQLLTGFSFELDGFDAGTLTYAVAPNAVTVASNGSFTELGPVNLLTAHDNGTNTWQLTNPFAALKLQFNPDAKYAILGPPSGPGDNYASANGSIKGNPGHNPFAKQFATFRIAVSGLVGSTTVSNPVFYFGTDVTPKPAGPIVIITSTVPLPSMAWAGLGLLASVGVRRIVGRRRLRRREV